MLRRTHLPRRTHFPRCCSVPLPECPEHSMRNTLPQSNNDVKFQTQMLKKIRVEDPTSRCNSN